MNITFKRQMNQSFMMIQDEFAGREVCELQMLSNNMVSALLPVEVEISDGAVCYWYNITGYQSLADYLSRKQLGMEVLALLFSGLSQLYSQLSEYLLSEASVLLKEEYIYLDFGGKGMVFSYVPGMDQIPAEAFQELMEQLLQRLDHQDRRAVEAGYEMYQLSLRRDLPLENMIRQVMGKYEADPPAQREIRQDLGRSDQEYAAVESLEASEAKDSVQGHGRGRFLDKVSRLYRRGNGFGFQEPEQQRIYVTDKEELPIHPTELLYTQEGIEGRLCYQGNKGWPDFTLGKGDFLIGKKRQEVDGYLPERTVSRIHARIEQEDGEYFLEDLNSTNGTFLNGERLEYHQKAKLASGDGILFGNVEFRFL